MILMAHASLALTFAWMTIRLLLVLALGFESDYQPPIFSLVAFLEAVAVGVTTVIVVGILNWSLTGRRRLVAWADGFAIATALSVLIPVLFMDASPIVAGLLGVVCLAAIALVPAPTVGSDAPG